jgi:hypothetical protein
MAVTGRRAVLPGLTGLPWARPLVPGTRRDEGPARRRPAAGAGTSRRSRVAVRARRSASDRAALAIAGIAVVFAGAFVSLSQSVSVSASSYDIVRLVSERDRLLALRQDLRNDVDRLAAEPALRKGAIDAGLGPLGAPIVLPAR